MDRPRGERTPTGRLLSNGIPCVIFFAIAVVLFAGVWEPTGPKAMLLYVLMPVGTLITGARALAAVRELRG
jgi:hypothetical protein